jgi:hypothetical protein
MTWLHEECLRSAACERAYHNKHVSPANRYDLRNRRRMANENGISVGRRGINSSGGLYEGLYNVSVEYKLGERPMLRVWEVGSEQSAGVLEAVICLVCKTAIGAVGTTTQS